MTMARNAVLALVAASVAGITFAATAGIVEITVPSPTLDRWMYPFNSSSPLGSELDATVFSPIGAPTEASFDNRDGQMIVGFDTAGSIAAGLPTSNYRILEARLTVVASRNNTFAYDPTVDPIEALIPGSGVVDPDAGQPVELFMCGYRGGWSLAGPMAFQENTPFNNGAPFPFPARGIRNAFAAEYNAEGALIDNSNNRDEARLARSLAVGQIDGLAPGAPVPQGSAMSFDIDVTDPDSIRYIRSSLAAGRLNMVVSSLAITEQQSSNVPAFYCKETPAEIGGTPASLVLRVCVGAPADWDCSGTVEVPDIFAFLSSWFAGGGDFNTDGVNDVPDIFAFLSSWFGA
jgi:hypothetical protein